MSYIMESKIPLDEINITLRSDNVPIVTSHRASDHDPSDSKTTDTRFFRTRHMEENSTKSFSTLDMLSQPKI